MQKYKNAKIGKRFLAYIIDYGIFGILGYAILNIFIIANFKDTINEVLKIQAEATNASTTVDINELVLKYQAVDGYSNFASSINVFLLVFLAVMVLYFVLLPLKWNKQTIGRAALNIKLVNKFDEKANFSALMMRQIVGRFIMLSLGFICGLGYIIQLVLMLRQKPIAIEDIIAGTKMIDLKNVSDEVVFEDNKNTNVNRYAPKETVEDNDSDDDVFDFINKK